MKINKDIKAVLENTDEAQLTKLMFDSAMSSSDPNYMHRCANVLKQYDQSKYCELIKKGTELNYEPAILEYGKCLVLGIGCPGDFAKAQKVFSKAKENVYAQALVAGIIGLGLGIPVDEKAADKILASMDKATVNESEK